MNVNLNITEEDLIDLSKLAEQQNKKRAIKTEDRISKRTQVRKLTESLSPITKKKEEVDETTKNLGDVIKDSIPGNDINQYKISIEIDSEDDNTQSNIRALANSKNFSYNMMETSRPLMISKNSFNLKQDDSVKASMLGSTNNTLSGDTLQMNDNIYSLTPDLYKAFSSTSYTGKPMKNENDILMRNKIQNDLTHAGVCCRSSKWTKFLTIALPKLVDDFQNKTFDEIVDKL